MGQVIDRTGLRYGRWTVIREADVQHRKSFWLCRCDCGTVRAVMGQGLANGSSRSCGRLNRERCADRLRAWNNGVRPEPNSWADCDSPWAVPKCSLEWIRRPIRVEVD